LPTADKPDRKGPGASSRFLEREPIIGAKGAVLLDLSQRRRGYEIAPRELQMSQEQISIHAVHVLAQKNSGHERQGKPRVILDCWFK
jgi:hypothetical protein